MDGIAFTGVDLRRQLSGILEFVLDAFAIVTTIQQLAMLGHSDATHCGEETASQQVAAFTAITAVVTFVVNVANFGRAFPAIYGSNPK